MPATRLKIFITNVQKEFQDIRRDLKAFLLYDAVLRRFISEESLRVDHPSLPGNPLIAESLYLARYIEKAGSGIQMMIEQCSAAALPEPNFEQRQGSFVNTLWRDWLTEEALAGYNWNIPKNRAKGTQATYRSWYFC